MAVTKRFEGAPLQVVCTPAMRAEVEALAETLEVSLAEIIRQAMSAGLPSVHLAAKEYADAQREAPSFI